MFYLKIKKIFKRKNKKIVQNSFNKIKSSIDNVAKEQFNDPFIGGTVKDYTTKYTEEQLIKMFETEYKNNYAIWRGNRTKKFIKWIEDNIKEE